MWIPAANWRAGVEASQVSAEAAALLVKKDLGKILEIDHASSLFIEILPWIPQVLNQRTMPQGGAASGPGTELKKLLARIGITASPTCPCNERARQMDSWGPEECLKRLNEISGWLAEEASKRKLPYIPAMGKALIRRAVSIAKHKATAKET